MVADLFNQKIVSQPSLPSWTLWLSNLYSINQNRYFISFSLVCSLCSHVKTQANGTLPVVMLKVIIIKMEILWYCKRSWCFNYSTCADKVVIISRGTFLFLLNLSYCLLCARLKCICSYKIILGFLVGVVSAPHKNKAQRERCKLILCNLAFNSHWELISHSVTVLAYFTFTQ